MGYYEAVFAEGALTEREKALIALAVAHTVQCPYCIDAYTQASLERDQCQRNDGGRSMSPVRSVGARRWFTACRCETWPKSCRCRASELSDRLKRKAYFGTSRAQRNPISSSRNVGESLSRYDDRT